MSITVHEPIPSKIQQLFCSFPFPISITVHKTNTNPTGNLFLPFYPSLPSSKHKYKSNRQFVPSFLSKPAFKQTQIQIQQAFCFFLFIQACLQANTKQITITVNTEQIKAKQIKTKHTSRSSLAEGEMAQQGSPARCEPSPDLCACLQDQTCQRHQRHQRRRDGSHQERV